MMKRTVNKEALEFERLADLAQGDIDPRTLRVRPGRPSISSLPLPGQHSPLLAARVSAEVKDQFVARATREGRSPSQVMRELVADYATGSKSPQGRVIERNKTG